MSKELDVILNATALLQAINSDNLESTIELVNWLNENFQRYSIENVPVLSVVLPLGNLIKYFTLDNKALEFTVNNLKNFDDVNGLGRIKWKLLVNTYLQKETETEEIASLLENYLDNNLLESYQISGFISICTNINRYDLLKRLQERIPLMVQ